MSTWTTSLIFAALIGLPVEPAIAANITVLVVSTPAAQAKETSTYVSRMIENANRALSASQTGHQLVLAKHKLLSSYVEARMDIDLARMRNVGDGQLANIHQWRNQFAADVVLLVADYSTGEPNTGAAWTIGPTSPADAFLVCDVDRCNASSEFIFAHEMGHIYGCQHETSSVTARGYRIPGTNITTLEHTGALPLLVRRLFYSADNVVIPAYGEIGDPTHNCRPQIMAHGNVLAAFR